MKIYQTFLRGELVVYLQVNWSIDFSHCRLRHGNETEVDFLVNVLPGVIVDFLPPMDAMNTVVTEVISQQQTRPWMAAIIMAKVHDCVIAIMTVFVSIIGSYYYRQIYQLLYKLFYD